MQLEAMSAGTTYLSRREDQHLFAFLSLNTDFGQEFRQNFSFKY
jgi:hypothetical protein